MEKLLDAFLKMEVGQVLDPKNDFQKIIRNKEGYFWENKSPLTANDIRTFSNLKVEIVSPEPAVFSVDDILLDFCSSDIPETLDMESKILTTVTEIKDLIEKCRTNFRLERDKELQPTIDAASHVIYLWRDSRLPQVQLLKKELKNIPPLEKTDNKHQ